MVDKREITPELLAQLTVTLFKHITVEDVLERDLRFDKLSAAALRRIMLKDEHFIRSRSDESCESLAYSVISYVNEKTEWQYNRSGSAHQECLNVFDLFLLTIQDLLSMSNNRPECRYEELMAWRQIVRHLGEEVALAAKAAQWDHEHSKPMRSRYDEFAWPYLTRHNNKQLNVVLRRGMSDHHCHLWASTPYFHVSWINLMNRVADSQFHRRLKKLDPEKWSEDEFDRRGTKKSDSARDHHGELSQARAAWIRFYLCERILGKTNPDKRHYDLKSVRGYNLWEDLLRSRDRLQSEIDTYTHQVRKVQDDVFKPQDYVLALAGLKKAAFSSEYQILIGERWLYYQVFRDYLKPVQQRILTDDDYNLFFVYLLIRLWIRDKMVQANDTLGFDNFQKHERRKALFLNDKQSERALIRLTVNEALKKDFMNELEVRITPEMELLDRLEAYVRAEEHQGSVEEFLAGRNDQHANAKIIDRYYYVIHFLKRKDRRQE